MFMPSPAHLIDTASKHLPPSPSDLYLLDVGGVASPHLRHRRDIVPHIASLRVSDWTFEAESMDGIITLDYPLRADFLREALRVLRSGGRLIMMQSVGAVESSIGQRLEEAGFVRILVEEVAHDGGLLIRGERLHTTGDTQERVKGVARRDADSVDWRDYRGRYVHLLIRQIPNKPIWKLTADEVIEWSAVGIRQDDGVRLLGFSSLPKAVAFMQPAILAGKVHDVNKVAKFRREVAMTWESLMLNPTLEDIADFSVTYESINPDSAEEADE